MPRTFSSARNAGGGVHFDDLTTRTDHADHLKMIRVRCNGAERLFKLPTRLSDDDKDCLICSETLERGSLAALPFCCHCNTSKPTVVHTACARAYQKFDTPKCMRESVKHLICQGFYDPAPPVLGYMTCTDIMRALDTEGVPAGRCDGCKMKLDTRQGHLLHMNLHHANADASLLSDGEKALLDYSPQLFRCVYTSIACMHCGYMDTGDNLMPHEQVCENLSDDQRHSLKQLLVDTRNKKQEIAVRRERDVRIFAEQQELRAARVRQERRRQQEDQQVQEEQDNRH
jgi:hypothetical protein